mmetsp:Transcript_11824/g.21509  ORF Transcript_11824/g.21509 Transcript_11824/m.21509 type:complete len:413 (-) Transcript_11824:126-1364(-)
MLPKSGPWLCLAFAMSFFFGVESYSMGAASSIKTFPISRNIFMSISSDDALIPGKQKRENRYSSLKEMKSFDVPTARRPSVDTGLRYRSDDWLRNFLSIPKSFVLGRIWFHLRANTLLAALVVALHKFGVPAKIPLLGHTLLGSFLGLLLVFRTNSAYARFYEARGYWTKTQSTCRNLALNLVTHIYPHSPKSVEKFMITLAAFPDALCFSCLSGSAPLPLHVLEVLGVQKSEDLKVKPATQLLYQMNQVAHEAAMESPSSGSDFLEATHLAEVSHLVAVLADMLSNCEKIVRTPVPLSYSRHTSRFLTLWCGTLPFALVGQLGVLTLPVVAVACWCLFGIEEIGHLIEQPFVGDITPTGDANDQNKGETAPLVRRAAKTQPYDIGLPAYKLAREIRTEVMEIGAMAAADII